MLPSGVGPAPRAWPSFPVFRAPRMSAPEVLPPEAPARVTPVRLPAAADAVSRPAGRLGTRVVVWGLLPALLLVLVSVLLLRFALWPRIDRFQPELERAVSSALGRTVVLDSLHGDWSGWLPALELEGLQVLDPRGGPPLRVERVEAVLSWHTLLAGTPRLAFLRVEGLDAELRRDDEGAWIAGWPLHGADDDRRTLRWLLAQSRIDLFDAGLRLVDVRAGARVPVARLDGIDLSVRNAGRSHVATLHLAGAQPFASSFEARADFVHPAWGRAVDVERWKGEAWMSAEELDLARLHAWLPPDLAWLPHAGRAGLHASMEADGRRVAAAVLRVGARGLRLRADGTELKLDRLRADATLTREDVGWELRLDEFRAEEPGGLRLALDRVPASLELDDDGRPMALAARLEQVDLAQALAFAGRLPTVARALPPMARGLGGRLEAARIEWRRPATANAQPQWRLDARFERLSLPPGPVPRPVAGWQDPGRPGFTNLSGAISARAEGGELDIDTGRASLVFPGVFEQPEVPVLQLAGRVGWSVSDDDGAALRVTGLQFRNEDAAGEVSGSWRAGGRGAGLIDLSGHLGGAAATRVARYLPVQLGRPVRAWVAASVQGGRAERADFRVKGDLAHFPFADPARGDFRVSVGLRDGVLRYAPDWPAIEEVQGELLFERNGMRIVSNSARVFGVRLTDVRATVPDFARARLQVEGGGTGPAQDMIRFVNQSPLRATIDDFTQDTRVVGNARLALRLDLPLDDPAAAKVDGGVTFLANEVVLDRTLPAFEAVSGRLAFTENALSLRDLEARFLGGPMKVSGETPEPGRMRLRAEGRATAAGLLLLADHPLLRKLSGEAGWRADIDVDRRASALRIESDLVGLESRLPAPLDKPAERALALRIQTRPELPADARARPPADRLEARLGEDIHAVLERERTGSDEKLRIHRAALAVGAEPVLPDTGLAVRVERDSLDADAWHALLSDEAMERAALPGTDEVAPGFSFLPGSVSVLAGRLRVAGKDMHDVVLGATREGGFWRANVRAREIDGFFNWREAAPGQPVGTLTARFTRLAIPESRLGEVDDFLDAAPAMLPALDVAADELVLGDVRMGPLELVASNGGQAGNPEWRVERLRVGAPAPVFQAEPGQAAPRFPADAPPALLEARGNWTRRPGEAGRSTQLDFELTVHDSGQLLQRFGMPGVLRGGQGVLAGQIGWNGSPLSLDYGSLDGRMRLEMGRGQFLKADPGIAKLIGVLNLQSLPRRLALDFRDVFANGFAFDRIEGDVRVEDGIALTDDFRMRGLQAAVRIAGEADLQRETQSLQVTVVPQLDAGLASLAYAALANPAVGLGAFAAQYVLRRPLQQLFTYQVDVTGPWDDPRVTPKN